MSQQGNDDDEEEGREEQPVPHVLVESAPASDAPSIAILSGSSVLDVSEEVPDNSTTRIVEATAVEPDLEQAQIRQELIQQAPQAECVEPQSSSNNNNIPRWIKCIILGLVLLTCSLAAAVVLLLLKNKESSSNSIQSETSQENNEESLATPRPANETCPCSFNTKNLSPNEGGPIMWCGPLRLMFGLLNPGEFGAGLCNGPSCEPYFPALSYDQHACGLVRKSLDGTTLEYSQETHKLLATRGQSVDCVEILSNICEEHAGGVHPGGGGRPPPEGGSPPPGEGRPPPTGDGPPPPPGD